MDEEAKRNEVIMGCKVEQRYELKECDGYIIAIGDNKKEKRCLMGLGIEILDIVFLWYQFLHVLEEKPKSAGGLLLRQMHILVL